MIKKIRWLLLCYDTAVYVLCTVLILTAFGMVSDRLMSNYILLRVMVGALCLLALRLIFGIYGLIWRYAGPNEYIKLMLADTLACIAYLIIGSLSLKIQFHERIALMFALNMLGCVGIRLLYQWSYQHRDSDTFIAKALLKAVDIFTDVHFEADSRNINHIRIAIVGAGSVGTSLADDLLRNNKAIFKPVCFIDTDKSKIGREIKGIKVISEDNLAASLEILKIQEVVFALPNITGEERIELYNRYKKMGYKLKSYDYPSFSTDNEGKRQLKDFDIEDLLFRNTNNILNEDTVKWYKGKSVLITGGGGSIGSELARQIARCEPKRLVILDVYENGAYDVQQELRTRYGEKLNLRIEIASVTDAEQVDKIFREHTPDVVIHAAAHKHVPLMERSIIEAVKNNVFGTLNVVNACEKYNVKKFILVSTDKAVNPTNVMGATKRMCEMIVQSRSDSKTNFSAVRFGNVLGSNGSVIPLFKRQIAAGGPVTITDKRIIRYFMTIPEACQLIMTSGSMAKKGELFVLDMGKPVKILDLAENMIRLSGFEPYKDIDITEIGLRPGEKLYEELLIKADEVKETKHEQIFIEKEKGPGREEVEKKLASLKRAIGTQSNTIVKEALMKAVPTFKPTEETNDKGISSEEMIKAAEI